MKILTKWKKVSLIMFDSRYAQDFQTTTNVIEEVNVEAQRLSPETGNFRILFNNNF